MTKLTRLPGDSLAYRDMVAALMPRGPIWTLDNAGVRGIASGLGVEAVRFHNRLVDLMLEAYPSTANELLSEWETVYGLPLCSDAPTTLEGRQAALAGRVAAQGGQDPAYYIAIVRAVLGDPDAVVTIVENPYGSPFYCWLSNCWDLLGSEGVSAYWQVILPIGVSPELQHIIECLLNEFKPAHTVLEIVAGVSAYYESLVGDGSSYLEASTNLAARYMLPGTGSVASFTLFAWVAQLDTNGRGIVQIGGHESTDAVYRVDPGGTLQSSGYSPDINVGMSLWFKVESGDGRLFIDNHPTSSAPDLIEFSVANNDGTTFDLVFDTASSAVATGLAVGVWHHLFVEGTFSILIHVNGALPTTGGPGTWRLSSNLLFGGTGDLAVEFTNIFCVESSDIGVTWPHAAVAALYAAGIEADGTTTIGDWVPGSVIAYWRTPPVAGSVINSVGGVHPLTVYVPPHDAIVSYTEGRDTQSFEVFRAGSNLGNAYCEPPDADSYFLFELACDGSDVTLRSNGGTPGTVALSGSFSTPADLFRLIDGGGGPARIRNIAIMPGALTSDERTALLAAQYRHDYRTSYDDGAGHVWAGRTMPFHWCTPAVTEGGGKVGIGVYTVEPGETLSTASGPFTGDVLLTFWAFTGDLVSSGPLVKDDGDIDAVMRLEATPGVAYQVQVADVGYVAALYSFPGRWHHFAIWSSGLAGDLTYYIDGAEVYNGPAGALNGKVVFGPAGALSTVPVTNIAYVQRTRDYGTHEAVIAALAAAGRSHDITAASGSWAAVTGTDLLARWTTEPVAGVVASDGATSLPLTFSAPPVPAKTAYVVNSGTAGECDLDLYGNTTSEED